MKQSLWISHQIMQIVKLREQSYVRHEYRLKHGTMYLNLSKYIVVFHVFIVHMSSFTSTALDKISRSKSYANTKGTVQIANYYYFFHNHQYMKIYRTLINLILVGLKFKSHKYKIILIIIFFLHNSYETT